MKILQVTCGEYSDFGIVAWLGWDREGDGGMDGIGAEFQAFIKANRDVWCASDGAERFIDRVLIPRGWKKLEHETLHTDYWN